MTTAIAQAPAKASLLENMAAKVGMEPAKYVGTIKATCFSSQATNEEFAAFMLVANKYGLDPLTKEIYAFPKKGGGIQPIVSIDGWIHLANSHPACNGIEFDDIREGGKLIAIRCRIHRKDRAYPTECIEYLDECKRGTDPWKQWPARMLRHKALIQCARIAFGFSGIIDPDEAERYADVVTTPQKPKRIAASKLNDVLDVPASPVSPVVYVDSEPVEHEPQTAPLPAIIDRIEATKTEADINRLDDELFGPDAGMWAETPDELSEVRTLLDAARKRVRGAKEQQSILS